MHTSDSIAKVPLGTGPPTKAELIAHYPAKFSWTQLRAFINAGDLALLKRDKALQKRFVHDEMPSVFDAKAADCADMIHGQSESRRNMGPMVRPSSPVAGSADVRAKLSDTLTQATTW
jgi:hypothetical protein